MKKWIEQFLIKRGFVKQVIEQTYAFELPTLSEIGKWTRSDAQALKDFFTTPLGTKFLSVLAKQAIENNEFAIKQKADFANESGFARGFNSYKDIFATLLPIYEDQSDIKAADILLERYRP